MEPADSPTQCLQQLSPALGQSQDPGIQSRLPHKWLGPNHLEVLAGTLVGSWNPEESQGLNPGTPAWNAVALSGNLPVVLYAHP